jgi:hypothetical protein
MDFQPPRGRAPAVVGGFTSPADGHLRRSHSGQLTKVGNKLADSKRSCLSFGLRTVKQNADPEAYAQKERNASQTRLETKAMPIQQNVSD